MAGAALALLAQAAAAQTIESLEWVEGSGTTVARITFAANVRFLRQAPAPALLTDLAQIGFQIVSAEEAVQAQTITEGKRLAAQPGRPRIDLSYTPVPKAQTKLLTLRLSEKVLLQVRQGPGAQAIDLVFRAGGASGQAASEELPEPAELPQDRRYVVLLQSTPAEQAAAMPRIPAAFQNYEVYTQNTLRDGVGSVDLVLGFFKTEKDAQTVRQRALPGFPSASVVTMARSVEQATAPVAPAAVAPVAAPGPQAQVEVNVADADGQGAALLAKAQLAFNERRYQDAVEASNQALMLPPNPSTPAAQELIGLAWEALNQPAKARSEYQLYQKLYPQGEAAQRVEQRLAALGVTPVLAQTEL